MVVPRLMKYHLVDTTYVCAFSDFFFQYTTDRVCTEELDSCVHGINGLGQNMKWHERNFQPNEIRMAATMLHSSAKGGYKVQSPLRLQRWKTSDVTVVYKCEILIGAYTTVG